MADKKKTTKPTKKVQSKSAGKKVPAKKKAASPKTTPKKKPASKKAAPVKKQAKTTTSTTVPRVEAKIEIVGTDGQKHEVDVVKTVSGVAPSLLVPNLVSNDIVKKTFLKKFFGFFSKTS